MTWQWSINKQKCLSRTLEWSFKYEEAKAKVDCYLSFVKAEDNVCTSRKLDVNAEPVQQYSKVIEKFSGHCQNAQEITQTVCNRPSIISITTFHAYVKSLAG